MTLAVSISSRVCHHDLKPDENQAQLMSDSGKVQINKGIDVSCYCCPLWSQNIIASPGNLPWVGVLEYCQPEMLSINLLSKV